MPRNTTLEELVSFYNRFGCWQKARRAEFRLSRWRKLATKKSA